MPRLPKQKPRTGVPPHAVKGDYLTIKYNLDYLKVLCMLTERNLRPYLLRKLPGLVDHTDYLYYENPDSDILVVAHMDTVSDLVGDFKQLKTQTDTLVMSIALDDRLGVYTILDLLPKLNIQASVVFTTDEELCSSTGWEFSCEVNKNFNWIVEFDRMGDDVVLYHYTKNKEFVDAIKTAGFTIGHGSYSDISDMEILETCCMNIGVGYHFPHTEQCCASLNQLTRQLEKFKTFYETNKDIRFEHIPDEVPLLNTPFPDYEPQYRDVPTSEFLWEYDQVYKSLNNKAWDDYEAFEPLVKVHSKL